MSVSNQIPVNSFTANGATTVFNFTFQLLKSTDLIVQLDGTTKTLGADYSVSGVGNPAGGSVTFTTAPANGSTITLARETVLERATDYQNNGDLRAATVNSDFDRIWLAIQEIYNRTLRAVKLPFGTTEDQALTENSAARSNTVIGFDSLGKLKLYVAQAGTSLIDLSSTALGQGIALIGNSIQRVTNVATLRTIAVTTSRDIQTQGYYAKGDGGHGTYYGVTGAAPGTYTDNGGSIIVPTGGNGSSAWLLKFDGYLNVKQFGANGDGVTDDTAAIQAAINFCMKSYDPTATTHNGNDVTYRGKQISLVLPSGIYIISTTLDLSFRNDIRMLGAAQMSSLLRWNGAAGGTMLNAQCSNFVTFEDFILDGNFLAKTFVYHAGNGVNAVGSKGNVTGNDYERVALWNQIGSLSGNAFSQDQYDPSSAMICTTCAQAMNGTVGALGDITGGTGYTNGTYTGVQLTYVSGPTATTYPVATIVVAGGKVTQVITTSQGSGFTAPGTVLTASAAAIGGTGSGFSVPVLWLYGLTGVRNAPAVQPATYANSMDDSVFKNVRFMPNSLNNNFGLSISSSAVSLDECYFFGPNSVLLSNGASVWVHKSMSSMAAPKSNSSAENHAFVKFAYGNCGAINNVTLQDCYLESMDYYGNGYSAKLLYAAQQAAANDDAMNQFSSIKIDGGLYSVSTNNWNAIDIQAGNRACITIKNAQVQGANKAYIYAPNSSLVIDDQSLATSSSTHSTLAWQPITNGYRTLDRKYTTPDFVVEGGSPNSVTVGVGLIDSPAQLKFLTIDEALTYIGKTRGIVAIYLNSNQTISNAAVLDSNITIYCQTYTLTINGAVSNYGILTIGSNSGNTTRAGTLTSETNALTNYGALKLKNISLQAAVTAANGRTLADNVQFQGTTASIIQQDDAEVIINNDNCTYSGTGLVVSLASPSLGTCIVKSSYGANPGSGYWARGTVVEWSLPSLGYPNRFYNTSTTPSSPNWAKVANLV